MSSGCFGLPRLGDQTERSCLSEIVADSQVHRSVQDHAAADVYRLAGDVARFVGSEKGDHVADVLRRLFPLHRRRVGDEQVEHLAGTFAGIGGIYLGDLRCQCVPEVGPYESRAYGVYGDVVRPQILGGQPRQAEHRVLGSRVGRQEGRVAFGSRGRDVDDLAVAALDHVRGDRLAEEEGALDVYVVVAVPLLAGEVGERSADDGAEVAGVVDEDVDGTEALDRLRDEVLTGGFIRYVRGDGDRSGPFAFELVGGGLRPVAVDVGRHDGRPFARQAFRYAEAHAAPGSGDDSCPVFESHVDLSYVL